MDWENITIYTSGCLIGVLFWAAVFWLLAKHLVIWLVIAFAAAVAGVVLCLKKMFGHTQAEDEQWSEGRTR